MTIFLCSCEDYLDIGSLETQLLLPGHCLISATKSFGNASEENADAEADVLHVLLKAWVMLVHNSFMILFVVVVEETAQRLWDAVK